MDERELVNRLTSIDRALQSMADGVFDNQKAIEENRAANEQQYRDLQIAISQTRNITVGNGNPEKGLLYRVTRAEEKADESRKRTAALIVAIVTNLLLTLGLAAATYAHIVG